MLLGGVGGGGGGGGGIGGGNGNVVSNGVGAFGTFQRGNGVGRYATPSPLSPSTPNPLCMSGGTQTPVSLGYVHGSGGSATGSGNDPLHCGGGVGGGGGGSGGGMMHYCSGSKNHSVNQALLASPYVEGGYRPSSR